MLGAAKNLGVSPHYVLYEISYENVIMYGKATPSYNDLKEKAWDPTLDANDPNNFINNANNEEEIIIR